MVEQTENTTKPEENLAPLDGEGGKNNKKKLIMILVPLLLLGGGGAGLYFTGMLDSVLGKEKSAEGETENATADHSEGKEEAKKDKEEGKKEEGGAATGPSFLKVPDLIVNLTSDGQPRYLRLSVQLELASEADMKAVEAVLPRVIDQFQTYLRELRVQDLRGSKGMYRLQMELLSRVNAAAYPTEVKDVLFQEILIQ
jgi:flagellar FliL protein